MKVRVVFLGFRFGGLFFLEKKLKYFWPEKLDVELLLWNYGLNNMLFSKLQSDRFSRLSGAEYNHFSIIFFDKGKTWIGIKFYRTVEWSTTYEFGSFVQLKMNKLCILSPKMNWWNGTKFADEVTGSLLVLNCYSQSLVQEKYGEGVFVTFSEALKNIFEFKLKTTSQMFFFFLLLFIFNINRKRK